MVPDAVIVCFSLSSCNNTTHSAVYYYLAQRSCRHTITTFQKNGNKKSTSCVPTTAAAAATARPPQPINPAAVGAVGFGCRPFDFTTHTVCCVSCGAKVALLELNKCLEKILVPHTYLVFIYFEARPRERSDRGRFLPLGTYTWLSFN